MHKQQLNIDRLYELLPTVYRMRDYKQGEPLKALLRVITEQVNLVEEDITQLYENWFIETCEDWVVPYIGELVGYKMVHEAGEPSTVDSPEGIARNKILIPRREVANTVRYRRRKGTLALLELLARDVAGWPSRVVAFRLLLAQTQPIKHVHLDRGRSIDLRESETLSFLDGAFDTAAHTIDIRRINSQYTQGRYNIPSVGLFVWRLQVFPVNDVPAYCQEAAGSHCFTFSVLGNDCPLYVKAEEEEDPTHIAEALNLPVPISRHLLESKKDKLYGTKKSLQIWKQVKGSKVEIPAKDIIIADLSDWVYRPRRNKVAVDPELGRVVFSPRHYPREGVWVRYHYGFSHAMGGGEYRRQISQASDIDADPDIYHVNKQGPLETINDALKRWKKDNPVNAVIEITDSEVYTEQLRIDFEGSNDPEKAGKANQQSLQIRAANKMKPFIRLLDWSSNQPDSIVVNGSQHRRNQFVLDGILIVGRGLQTTGQLEQLTVRHSTLVPGWSIDHACKPHRPTEPSLELFSTHTHVVIENSIIGSIQVEPVLPESESGFDEEEADAGSGSNYAEQDTVVQETMQAGCQGISHGMRLDPVNIHISDSIIDATHPELEAIGAPGCPVAHAVVDIQCSTIIGLVQVHAIDLGENSIFNGKITVARRQRGCLRFSYVTPESRTPKRYRCQPDLVRNPLDIKLSDSEKERETLRLIPRFNSQRYGEPTYCQLSSLCATEITQGADDESEMGVFHDLYQTQRMTNLSNRLDEYIPAGMDVGVIIAS